MAWFIQDHAVREVIGQLHQEEIRSFGRRLQRREPGTQGSDFLTSAGIG